MNYFSLQIFKFVLLYGLHFQVCDFSLFFSLLSLFSLFIDPRALFFFFSSPHFSFSFLLLFFFVSFIIFLFALITLSYFFQCPLEEIFHFLSFSFLFLSLLFVSIFSLRSLGKKKRNRLVLVIYESLLLSSKFFQSHPYEPFQPLQH